MIDEKEPEKSTLNILKPVGRNSHQNSEIIHNCKNAQQLLKLLSEMGYDFDEEQKLIICNLCNQFITPSERLKKIRLDCSHLICLYIS